MRFGRLLFLGAVVLAGCGGSSTSGLPHSLTDLYSYDTHAPFDRVSRVVVSQRIPIVVRDLSFSDARGGTVSAYVAVPAGTGPFAGVVLVPGSGGRRIDFLIESIQLAARGAVAMSIVTPFIQGMPSEPSAPLADARFYRKHFEDNVVAIRRAFDLLERRKDVDPHRLGLAGYSLGGALASVVAGVDPRPRAVSLVAPPSHVHFFPPLRGRTATRAYRLLAPVDPKIYLRHTHAKLLVDMARYDEIQTRPEQRAMIRAAGPDSTVRWYPSGHGMDVQAWNGLVRWLGDQLQLGPLPRYARVPA